MANGISMTTPAVRGTAPRESFSIPITPVDGKRFESEIRRTDAAVADVKKAVEKQDDKFTRAIEKLESTLYAKFEKIEQRFEKMDQRFEKLEDKMDSNFKWLIGTNISLMGALAAFYAFATYIKP